jgi:hypothetical protein
VVGYWQANLSNPLALLKERAIDEHPRVRLEAVRACSFLPTAKAMEVALSVTRLPMDKYLEYTLAETIKQLQSQQE